MNRIIIIAILIFCILTSCVNYSDRYGYLVFTDSEYVHFYPVNGILDLTTSYGSFVTNKIEEGWAFNPTFNNAFYYSVFEHLDTLKIKNKNIGLPERIRTLKILPVRIKFRKISDEDSLVYSDTIQIKDRTVICKWSSGHYSVRRVTFIPYDHINRVGPYFEEAPICPLSEGQVIKEKKALKKIGKTTWRF